MLVTGSTGWIGKAVVKELEGRGHPVQRFDLRGSGLDITNRVQVRRSLTMGVRPDVVINLAGVLGTSETFGDLTGTATANILGAINFLDVCAENDIPFVQIGTGHKGQPNPYAITKACAEDLTIALALSGAPFAVVRAYHAYGPSQKVHTADGGTGGVRKIFPSFAVAALRNEPITIYGSGNNVIDMVHVYDVASCLADTAGDVYAGGGLYSPGVVVSAGTGVGRTVLDVARDIIDATGSTAGVRHVDMRPGEPDPATVVAPHPARPTDGWDMIEGHERLGEDYAACPDRWEDAMPVALRWYEDALKAGTLP